MLGWSRRFISWTSWSIFFRLDASRFILSTITSFVVRWVTCSKPTTDGRKEKIFNSCYYLCLSSLSHWDHTETFTVRFPLHPHWSLRLHESSMPPPAFHLLLFLGGWNHAHGPSLYKKRPDRFEDDKNSSVPHQPNAVTFYLSAEWKSQLEPDVPLIELRLN